MKFLKDVIYLCIISLLIASCGQIYYTYKYQPTREINVYYNRDTQLNQKIIKVIQNADKFVYFGIYTFTRTDIKDALLGAKKRGLDVRGITDRKQLTEISSQGKIIEELKNAGIPILTQDHLAIMHLKTVVTDKQYASGSFNWTSAATNLNDEVLEIGSDESVRYQYEKILKKIFAQYAG
mgnify:CR=1 FL=1